MRAAYAVDVWEHFFSAAASAGAGLAGLIFVALSVNLAQVLEVDRQHGLGHLTGRALEAVIAPLVVVVVSLTALVPSLPRLALAATVLGGAFVTSIIPARALFRGHGLDDYRRLQHVRLTLAFAMTFALLLSAVTLVACAGGGLYWIPPAFAIAVAVAAANAWILLVEIAR